MMANFNWEPIKAKGVELFTSNVPSCVPSYSDAGKAIAGGTIAGITGVVVQSVVWILSEGAKGGFFGGWGWIAAGVGVVIHYGWLFISRGSESKIKAIKAAEHPDDPTDAQPQVEAKAA